MLRRVDDNAVSASLEKENSPVFRYLHWILSALLLLGVAPAFHAVGLQFIFDWHRLLTIYWIGLTAQSLLVTAFLCIVAFPLQQTLIPFWNRCRKDKLRLPLLVAFGGFMFWQFGWAIGLMLTVDVLMVIEVLDRIPGGRKMIWRLATNIVLPAAYFFVGLLLVFSYNDVIASAVDIEKYTPMYLQLDSILLLGSSVSAIAHAVMGQLPVFSYRILEGIYFGMFAQLGAGLFLTAAAYGKRRSLAYIGTLLTAYYLALLVFVVWPAGAPVAACQDHFSRFPEAAALYNVQKADVDKPRLLFSRTATTAIDTDYFIPLPCMHIALPLIMLWFIRKWRRMFAVLLVYDAMLFVSILLLEQHYLIDLIAGVIAAAVAIALVEVPKEESGEKIVQAT
jgi:hypothetical protein